MRFAIGLLLYCFAVQAHAVLVLPTNLSNHDRGQAVTILGYGSAGKILDDPYPLGGFSGFEFGLASEMIGTSQLATLGTKTPVQGQTNYFLVTLGKGLYDNIDTFLQFSYSGQGENIVNFGGQVRWNFFQAEYLPIYLSTVFHDSNTNFNNLISVMTYGLDLILGVHEGDLTIYFGSGIIRSMGTFSGGTGGITDSGNTEQNGVEDSRVLTGITYKINKVFLAGEIDRYVNVSYALKLGMRF